MGRRYAYEWDERPARTSIDVILDDDTRGTGLLDREGKEIRVYIPRNPVGFVHFPERGPQ